MEVLRRLAHSWIVHPLDLDIGEVGGQPDSDYLQNRIAGLTFDLRTGEAQIDRI
jgi:hypothetical protein